MSDVSEPRLSGVKLVTQTHWVNRYGGHFLSEAEAIKDEQLRNGAEWQLRVIGTPIGEQPYSVGLIGKPYRAIDDSKSPYTGQPEGTSQVYLLKERIAALQALVDKHGPMVGEVNHHCGCGIYSTELCVLEPCDGRGRPTGCNPLGAP
jgi:hypothetical protein